MLHESFVTLLSVLRRDPYLLHDGLKKIALMFLVTTFRICPIFFWSPSCHNRDAHHFTCDVRLVASDYITNTCFSTMYCMHLPLIALHSATSNDIVLVVFCWQSAQSSSWILLSSSSSLSNDSFCPRYVMKSRIRTRFVTAHSSHDPSLSIVRARMFNRSSHIVKTLRCII